MLTQIEPWQVALAWISLVCFAGAVICTLTLIASLAWEFARSWKRTAYQRALRRYYSAQESLRAAGEPLRTHWGHVPMRWL